jgi:hypothetical protein
LIYVDRFVDDVGWFVIIFDYRSVIG